MRLTSSLTMAAICAAVSCNYSIAQSSSPEDNKSIISGTSQSDVLILEVESESKGGIPAPLAASFVEVGAPSGGYPSITDIVTFNGKLHLTTSANPLSAFGTKVFFTSDGVSYTKVLEDATSQGYLRIGLFDNKLWIPDGDPNGLDPSFVYTSTTGLAGSFTQTQILGAVHSFEMIKYNNQFYVANGMGSGVGGLCKYDGANTWNQVYSSSSSVRLKYMATAGGKLLVSNKNTNSDIDGFLWSGDPGVSAPVTLNPLAGATNTFRLFVSSTGKFFWSIAAGSTIRVLTSSNGSTWTQCSTLDGKLVSDFAELNGKLYALASNGLWESSDYLTFTNIAAPPTSDPNAFVPAAVGPGINPDSPGSMEAYNGFLWCGSARNGKVYKVDVSTSVPEALIASHHYTVTDHSIIFQMESSSSIVLRVYGINGSLVKSVSLGTVGKGNYEISLEELKKGAYLLEAIIGDEVKGIKYVRR